MGTIGRNHRGHGPWSLPSPDRAPTTGGWDTIGRPAHIASRFRTFLNLFPHFAGRGESYFSALRC